MFRQCLLYSGVASAGRCFGTVKVINGVSVAVRPATSTLSSCMHAVVALLYPFSWQHTFIPVLPGSMLDIVCCPTPFLVGLLSSSLPKLKELPVEEVSESSVDITVWLFLQLHTYRFRVMRLSDPFDSPVILRNQTRASQNQTKDTVVALLLLHPFNLQLHLQVFWPLVTSGTTTKHKAQQLSLVLP